MKAFKLLSGVNIETDTLVRAPLLENEQWIRYWNDGDYHNLLSSAVIAWARGTHAFDNNWVEHRFEGTMEEFFYARLDIPVILSIEALVDDGATFYEDDREYLDNINFQFPVKIIYFQYEPF